MIIAEKDIKFFPPMISFKGHWYQAIEYPKEVKKGDILVNDILIQKVIDEPDIKQFSKNIEDYLLYRQIEIVTHLTDEGITYTIAKEENDNG